MAKTIDDPIENVLGRVLGLAGQAMKVLADKNLAEANLDLRLEHIILLRTIFENEGINQHQITFFTFRDKTAITRYIDHLEKKNLVLRVPDKQDRRQKLIYLTNEAKKLSPKFMEMAKLTEQEATVGIPAKDVQICKDVLKQVRKNLLHLVT
ncbi:MAG: MarR family transcriptional regulator [bacterium]